MKLKQLAILTFLGFAFTAGCNEDEPEISVVVTTENFTATINEDPTEGQVLGNVKGTTSQGEVTFSLTAQEPADAMSIDASTGELKVKDVSAFDFEIRTEVTAVVAVKSGEVSEEAKVAITITDVPVTISKEDFKVSIDENPTTGQGLGTLTASASEGSLAFSIAAQDVADALAVNESTGELTVETTAVFDFETITSYSATVTAAGGSASVEIKVAITIKNVTEITTSDFTASLDENPTNGQSLGSIKGTADLGSLTFSISSQNPSDALAIDESTGALTVKDSTLFDYETRTSVSATVLVKSGEVSEEVNVALTLRDIASTWQAVGATGFSSGTVYHTKITFDNGIPYVVFEGPSGATVMKYDGTQWVNVGTPGLSIGSTTVFVRLAFNNGTPYVSFQDGSNNSKVTVMKYDGTNWINVGNAGFSAGIASHASLAFNNGTPYVSFQDWGNDSKATVMKYNGTNWVNVGNPGFSAGAAVYSVIKFDSNIPYVIYQDDSNAKKATAMKYDGTNWVYVGNAGGFSAGEATDLSFTFDNGIPYVAYGDSPNSGKATVMKFNGTNWVSVGTAGFSAGQANSTSLAFSSNIPYVAFQDGGNSDKATAMKFDGKAWKVIGTAGFSAGLARYTDLAFDKGIPYVVYQDASNSSNVTVMKFDD